MKRYAPMFLPESIAQIIAALEKAGYAAYVVGGCVRDACLGLTPQDYDMCTSATPEQTEAVFADQRLVLAGITRALGKRPFFLLYVAVCMFFLVYIVTQYQLWSANPQMQDYVFALLAAMALMFFGFYEASQEAGCGNSRMKLGMGLAAIYLCLAELARSSCPALYLGGILWVLTELVTAEKRVKR